MYCICFCRLLSPPLEVFEQMLSSGECLLHSCVSLSFQHGGVGNQGLNFGRKLLYFHAHFSFQLRGVRRLALQLSIGRSRPGVRSGLFIFRQFVLPYHCFS